MAYQISGYWQHYLSIFSKIREHCSINWIFADLDLSTWWFSNLTVFCKAYCIIFEQWVLDPQSLGWDPLSPLTNCDLEQVIPLGLSFFIYKMEIVTVPTSWSCSEYKTNGNMKIRLGWYTNYSVNIACYYFSLSKKNSK